MLEVLCGTKNVQRILIFLFVNGKCYGAQLQRSFNVSLTPIQKALNRLEKGGLISSCYEGKTRVYQFNPTYPLLSELELLLKKAYTLLPGIVKKDYYVLKNNYVAGTKPQEHKGQVILAFWKKLQEISKLTFHAKTNAKENSGWDGKGEGEVFILKEGSGTLIFTEKGSSVGSLGNKMNFSNVFRWTLDRSAGLISLEHLRRGPERPVFLFHLTPSGKDSLVSVDPHLCGGDSYFGQIQFDSHSIRLHWRVIGPKKNEEIEFFYS